MMDLRPIAVVQDEIYGSIMTLHLCEQDLYLEYISRFDVMKKLHDTAKNNGLAVQIKDSRTGRIWYSVWMKEFDIANNIHQSILHHEINHVALFTLFGARINTTLENQEPFAYLAQFLYRKTTDMIKKKQAQKEIKEGKKAKLKKGYRKETVAENKELEETEERKVS